MVFKHFDIDGDNYITREEFAKVLKELGEKSSDEDIDAFVNEPKKVFFLK